MRLPAALRFTARVTLATLTTGAAHAADAAPVPGAAWALPFAALLLTIALGPLLVERLWHRRQGVIAATCAAALLLPWAVTRGPAAAASLAWHALLLDYLPFTAVIFALFTVGAGIVVHGGPWGRPGGNTLLLALGTLAASLMGTTGAAMVLIHPLLRANAWRARKTHLAVFFILLVGNVGGSLSPLGDPPLFLGYLRGVPFLWPARHLLAPMLVMAGVLLSAFYLLDRRLAAREPGRPPAPEPLRLRGLPNLALLGGIILVVLAQGLWQPGPVALLGTPIGLERLVGAALLVALGLLSLAITSHALHNHNMFSWGPLIEIAKLFAAIFITMAPVLTMLEAGPAGPFAALVALMTDPAGRPVPAALFWGTGLLSAVLDNAPTYLVFFELAGGDAARLAGQGARDLAAISAGAVFFGALTYIGNAPNFMVRAIAAHRGVHMPGFFGYLLWSLALMLPPLALVTFIFFR